MKSEASTPQLLRQTFLWMIRVDVIVRQKFHTKPHVPTVVPTTNTFAVEPDLQQFVQPFVLDTLITTKDTH